MLTRILSKGVEQPHTPKEGDLYKEVTISDKTFRLLYGYYESFERESPFNDPMPIYPDFIKEPHYTAEGIPIATAMQNVCEFYNGKNDEDSSCSDCVFFKNTKNCLVYVIALVTNAKAKKGRFREMDRIRPLNLLAKAITPTINLL